MTVIVSRELRDAVKSTMSLRGHEQGNLIDFIVDDCGASRRSQSSISRYLSGQQAAPPEVLDALQMYLDKFQALPSDDDAPTSGEPMAGDDAFDGSVRDVSGEPLLGPRQAALVDAAIARLAGGPTMSEGDRRTFEDLRRIVGLNDRHGTS